MPTPPESQVSLTRDPAALDLLLHTTTWKKIRAISEKWTKHNSHLLFIQTALQKNLTPHGLRITKKLQTTEATGQLHAQWRQIARQAEIKLMQALKQHHKEKCKVLKLNGDKLKQELRRNDRDTADQAFTILDNSLKTLQENLEEGGRRN